MQITAWILDFFKNYSDKNAEDNLGQEKKIKIQTIYELILNQYYTCWVWFYKNIFGEGCL
jgi:hypothetical protein